MLAFLAWLLGKLFGKPSGPSQEAVQAKQAGAAETALQTERVSNEAVLQASAARDEVVRAAASDSGLREYERTDPNNRDA